MFRADIIENPVYSCEVHDSVHTKIFLSHIDRRVYLMSQVRGTLYLSIGQFVYQLSHQRRIFYINIKQVKIYNGTQK